MRGDGVNGSELTRALKEAGISRSTFYARRQRGMTVQEALKPQPDKVMSADEMRERLAKAKSDGDFYCDQPSEGAG